jgi:hypothetical protein
VGSPYVPVKTAVTMRKLATDNALLQPLPSPNFDHFLTEAAEKT